MADITFISQVALGTAAAVQLKTLFTSLAGGKTYAIKNVSGSITVGTSSAVTASNGYPLAAGESIAVDGANLRNLWVIGGSTDRIAVMVLQGN